MDSVKPARTKDHDVPALLDLPAADNPGAAFHSQNLASLTLGSFNVPTTSDASCEVRGLLSRSEDPSTGGHLDFSERGPCQEPYSDILDAAGPMNRPDHGGDVHGSGGTRLATTHQVMMAQTVNKNEGFGGCQPNTTVRAERIGLPFSGLPPAGKSCASSTPESCVDEHDSLCLAATSSILDELSLKN